MLGTADLSTTYRLRGATLRKLLDARALVAAWPAPPGVTAYVYWGPSGATFGHRARGLCVMLERDRDGKRHRRFAVRPYRGPAAVACVAAYLAALSGYTMRPMLSGDMDRENHRRAADAAFADGRRWRQVFGPEFGLDTSAPGQQES